MSRISSALSGAASAPGAGAHALEGARLRRARSARIYAWRRRMRRWRELSKVSPKLQAQGRGAAF